MTPKPSRAERDERVIEVVVGVRCPGCHATRTIRACEMPADDFPMCFACGLPMIVEAARTNITRKRRGAERDEEIVARFAPWKYAAFTRSTYKLIRPATGDDSPNWHDACAALVRIANRITRKRRGSGKGK